jgi:hypothetical protein
VDLKHSKKVSLVAGDDGVDDDNDDFQGKMLHLDHHHQCYYCYCYYYCYLQASYYAEDVDNAVVEDDYCCDCAAVVGDDDGEGMLLLLMMTGRKMTFSPPLDQFVKEMGQGMMMKKNDLWLEV